MSPRDWRLRVQDILDAIATIQLYTAGMDYFAFTHDRKTMDAVLRNITVIGEAASRVPETIQGESPEVPWADMRDIRCRSRILRDQQADPLGHHSDGSPAAGRSVAGAPRLSPMKKNGSDPIVAF